MGRETLYTAATRVVKPSVDFLQSVSYPRLHRLITSAPRDSEELGRGIQNLLDVGLLSDSKQGNYSLSHGMIDNHLINLFIGENMFYYTLERDVDGISKKFNVPLSIVKHGEYVIPETPSGADWRIIHLKARCEKEGRRIVSDLLEKGILSRRPKDNFAVASQGKSPHSRYYVYFGHYEFHIEDNPRYFTRIEDARNFAEALSMGGGKFFVVDDKKEIVE